MSRSFPSALKLHDVPDLSGGTLLLALSGWMDGGHVSTGTVERLVSELRAERIGSIEPEGFFIESFPGDMEVSAMFRPHVAIRDGTIDTYDPPENVFYGAAAHGLVLLSAKEPNLHWESFSDCIFHVAREAGLQRILFVGSVAGSVPHTREPKLRGVVSEERLKPELDRFGVRPVDYEGPASFSTRLMVEAPRRGLEMITLVTEVPSYIEGPNAVCMEAVIRRLASILDLPADMARLRADSDEWVRYVSQMVEDDPDLAEKVRKLESEHDEELLGSDDWPTGPEAS